MHQIHSLLVRLLTIRLIRVVPGASARVLPFLEAVGECSEAHLEEREVGGRNANTDHDAMLEDYIEEANAICKKWRLATEFEICCIDVDSAKLQSAVSCDSQNVVAIRKKLGDRRYAVENWGPAEFERQLRFLRDIAESLEMSSAPTTLEASVTTENDQDATKNAEQATDAAKVSVERLPDNTTSKPPAETPMKMQQCGGNPPPPPSSLRLLGLGRIYLDGAHPNAAANDEKTESSDDSPLPVAIHSTGGMTVGILETYVTHEVIPPPKARRASQTLAWRPPKASASAASGSGPCTHSVRVRLGKLRLNECCNTGVDTVWVLLKQATNDASNNVLAAKRVHPTAGADGRQIVTFDVTHTVNLPATGTVAVEI